MKNKVLYVVMIIVILLGCVMMAMKGFNSGILYSKHKRIEVVIGGEYNLEDVAKIAKETIKEKSIVRKTTLFETSVAIDAKDIKEEEIFNLFSKLNEKYGKDYDVKDLKRNQIFTELNVTDVASKTDEEITELISQIKEKYNLEYTKEELQDSVVLVRLSDVNETNIYDTLKYMIVPSLIALGLVIVYFGIRFHKLYKKAWLLEPIKLVFRMFVIEAFVLSVVVIARIPFAQYLASVMIFVWLLIVITCTVQNEKRLKDLENVEG